MMIMKRTSHYYQRIC